MARNALLCALLCALLLISILVAATPVRAGPCTELTAFRLVDCALCIVKNGKDCLSEVWPPPIPLPPVGP